MSPLVGYAELARVFADLGEAATAAVARGLGFERRASVVELRSAPAMTRHGSRTGVLEVVPPTEPAPKVVPGAAIWSSRFLCPARVEFPAVDEKLSDPLPPSATPLTPAERAAAPVRQARPAPSLAPWPRLLSGLEPALRSVRRGNKVDVRALIARSARGEVIRSLPRRAFVAVRDVIVLVDRSERLVPFRSDQDVVAGRLHRRFGDHVRVCYLPHGPEGPVFCGGRLLAMPWSVPTASTWVALSDLGIYGGRAERAAWRRSAGTHAEHGHTLRALVPAPRGRFVEDVAEAWSASPWEARASAARLDAQTLAQRRDRLLALVPPAARIEPGLLRAVRRLLPSTAADVGTEADAWLAPGWRVRHSTGAQRDARAEVPAPSVPESSARRAAAVGILRAWHDATLPVEVQHQDTLLLLEAGWGEHVHPAQQSAAAMFLQRLVRTRAHGTDAAFSAAVDDWFLDLERRIPDTAWTQQDVGLALQLLWGVVHRHDHRATPPPGVDPTQLAGILPPPPPQWFSVRQVGDALRFDREATAGPGSPLLRLLAAEPQVFVWAEERVHKVRLEASASCVVPLRNGVVIVTDRERVEIDGLERPAWASAIGRDRFGLWVEFEVNGVRVRLRYVPPGRCRMGSPEGEEGRFDDEGPQREVTLTRGHWLADTPCTQALWTAVMGNNPSRFVTPDRPVEQVSFDDCNEFFDRINRRVDGLELRLPTEAEWERACRADTETSTYAGEMVIAGLYKAVVLDDIAWYGGNSGDRFDLEKGADPKKEWGQTTFPWRNAGTRPVARKRANAFGLFDMLGNVWEWCSDFWGAYPDEDRVDPQGPVVGSVRVRRGGAWYSTARFLRAARRRGVLPGLRLDVLGFRLARGQGLRPAEPDKKQVSTEPGRAGGRRGTRRRQRGEPRE